MLRKLFGGLGFILLLIGVGCADSSVIALPALISLIGAFLISICAKMDSEWTEEG